MYHNILLVEDDPEDQYIFIEATKHFPDLVISTARNGIEGIALLSGGLLPDIIILDLNMPKMDGLEFLKANSVFNYFDGPVVVLSTSGAVRERDECLKWGAVKVYSKPDSMSELERMVEEMFDTSVIV